MEQAQYRCLRCLCRHHLREVVLHLLPALPRSWAEGKVTGLRARGGYTVDITWQDGKVTAYRIASATQREVKVRINGETKTIQSEQQQGN